jgi:hypothetical protein
LAKILHGGGGSIIGAIPNSRLPTGSAVSLDA